MTTTSILTAAAAAANTTITTTTVVTMCRRPRAATPWFDAECRDARRKARTAERRFRRKRTDADKQVWANKAEGHA